MEKSKEQLERTPQQALTQTATRGHGDPAAAGDGPVREGNHGCQPAWSWPSTEHSAWHWVTFSLPQPAVPSSHAPALDILFSYLGLDMSPFNSFSDGAVGKESICSAGDTGDAGSIPGSGRLPGGGNGNPLQYSFLENSMHKGAWRATAQRVPKIQTR